MPERNSSDNDRLACAFRRFDEANAQDPTLEHDGGEAVPRELLYARRLTGWVLRLDPAAAETLRLAARCQHVCRWQIPRSNYPLTRAGYHQWRNALKEFHAEVSGRILAECGYDPAIIAQVQALNRKEHFPADPDSRTLEDALCLVFLEYQFAELAAKTEPEKVINALRKSWAKMSGKARSAALALPYSPTQKQLLEKALP